MRLGAAAVLICAPAIADAQDLSATLAETFAPVADVASLTDMLTCTALYRSLSLLLGPDSEMSADFRTREGFMASIAGILWAEQDGVEPQSPDAVFAVLLPLITAATDHYLAYMDDVAAQSDAPFDDTIFAQVDFCNAIFETLQADAE